MRCLSGDVGGTNSRLAVLENGRIVFSRQYPSRHMSGLEEALLRFQEDLGSPLPEEASFAIAGVVEDQQVQATNIPWSVSARNLKKQLGFKRVVLLNDFEAAAWGILALDPDDLVRLGGGAPDPRGPKAILGAGTGLGQALIIPCGNGKYKVVPTEGGHVDFAPNTEEQIGLLRFLKGRMEHVSVEQILSGPGLINIYRYLSSRTGTTQVNLSPEEISRRALEDPAGTEAQALRIFVQVYGAEAGNLALKCLARGGVYVAGGIAPQILPALREWGFRRFFEAKGRMKKVLQDIPTWVVTNTDLGLIGAAYRLATA